MNRRFLKALALLPLFLPAFVHAQAVEKPWMGRLRILNLNPANESDPFTALGTAFPSDAVHVSNKTFPEVDLSYFFTKNFALELVLTYPQKHDVVLAGVGNIGDLDHLPPCLVAQYHFGTGNPAIKPYVGAGFNYTRITRADLVVGTTALDIERDSFGIVLQVGVDYQIGENLYLNLDYKRANIEFDVRAGGSRLTTASLNPNLFSVGVGFRF
jgi:outer membrane protein